MKYEIIKEKALSRGAAFCEVIKLEDLDFNTFAKSLSRYPEGLSYLKKNENKIKNPKLWFEGAQSVLICLFPYWDKTRNWEEENKKISDPEIFLKNNGRKIPDFLKGNKIKISRFALGPDYHISIRKILESALLESKKEIPDLSWKIFVDSSPVSEKIWAEAAGLAFIGKNTLAVNEYIGSYFFIGGAMLNLKEGIKPQKTKSLCADCSRCVFSCPTKALEPYSLNPLKCISYWTTHNKKNVVPPKEIEKECSDKYGCDICQKVCPYNKNYD
ncbi:MAG: QueG-associated DUF1730 domain-containing protein [Elusimicrobiota bacterium]